MKIFLKKENYCAMNFKKHLSGYVSLLLLFCIGIFSCQKFDRPGLGDFVKDPDNPGGALKFYTAFDNTDVDSIRANFAASNTTTYAPGITGMAMKGATGKYITYGSANDVGNITSFTVSLWINTQKHDGGAQMVFMLPRTDDFWGNMFLLIEGNNGPTDSMLIKFHFAGQWVEFLGVNRLPNMYGAWHHLVFTYDETTSKFAAYLDGVARNLPASMTDRKNGANPLGKAIFKNPSKFIFGGFQQHLGSPWGAPDTWMLNYTGLLDQFRIYNKALTPAEVSALYASKL